MLEEFNGFMIVFFHGINDIQITSSLCPLARLLVLPSDHVNPRGLLSATSGACREKSKQINQLLHVDLVVE